MLELRQVRTDTLLVAQKPTSFIRDFDYSINPYGGCAFACAGCYVPDLLFGAAERKGGWGSYVEARVRAAAILERRKEQLAGKTFFMSPTTDIYQPAERRFRLTRALLEVLRDTPFEWGLLSTRSPLILEDLELLRSFGPRLEVGISLPSDLETVRRRLDPKNPPVAARLRAARALKDAGIAVRLQVAPMQPHSADFPYLAGEAAHWVWIDHAAHLRVAGPAFRAAGMEEVLSRPWVEEQVARWRAVLGPDRVGYGQPDFSRRWHQLGAAAGTIGVAHARKGGIPRTCE
jgi:DNA repair photolyase